MPNMVQGFGPQGFEPSGGPQVMSAEEKLADMLRMMQGAPNSVLQMISRIFQSGNGPQPYTPPNNAQFLSPEGYQRMFPMPPVHGPIQFPGVNAGEAPAPMRPSEPSMMVNPGVGWIRG